MKKITLQIFCFLCLISTISIGQTYSSGAFSTGGIDGQIDINTTTNIVTLTLIGPSSGWLALGFDTNDHVNGKDVVMFDGTLLRDREFTSDQEPPNADTSGQNWTVTDNTINGGIRTVVATRARVSPDSNDYTFSATPTTLNVVGARNSTFSLNNEHDNVGSTTLTFTVLGVEDFNKITFTMSPNPAVSDLKVFLPSHLNKASIEIFDVLGRPIYNKELRNTHSSVVDVSLWNRGVYLVRVTNDNSSLTKRFVKQ